MSRLLDIGLRSALWSAANTLGLNFATVAAVTAIGPRFIRSLLRRVGRPLNRSCHSALRRVLGRRLHTLSRPTVFILSQEVPFRQQTVQLLVFLARTSENALKYVIVDMTICKSVELVKHAYRTLFLRDQGVRQKPDSWEIYDNYTPQNPRGPCPSGSSCNNEEETPQPPEPPTEPLEDRQILELTGHTVCVQCTHEELEEILSQSKLENDDVPDLSSVISASHLSTYLDQTTPGNSLQDDEDSADALARASLLYDERLDVNLFMADYRRPITDDHHQLDASPVVPNNNSTLTTLDGVLSDSLRPASPGPPDALAYLSDSSAESSSFSE